MEFYNSWRESPKVPADWAPRKPPGTWRKFRIKNKPMLAALREKKPGRWYKIYGAGADGSSIHFYQHESGCVFDVEHHPRSDEI